MKTQKTQFHPSWLRKHKLYHLLETRFSLNYLTWHAIMQYAQKMHRCLDVTYTKHWIRYGWSVDFCIKRRICNNTKIRSLLCALSKFESLTRILFILSLFYIIIIRRWILYIYLPSMFKHCFVISIELNDLKSLRFIFNVHLSIALWYSLKCLLIDIS